MLIQISFDTDNYNELVVILIIAVVRFDQNIEIAPLFDGNCIMNYRYLDKTKGEKLREKIRKYDYVDTKITHQQRSRLLVELGWISCFI